jgi:peptidoglycan-associated lipoprotein
MVQAAIAAAAILTLGTACASSGGSSTDTESSGTGSEFQEPAAEPAPIQEETLMKVDPSTVLQPVYFNYDRFEIRTDARPILQANADAVSQHSDWGVIVVEGHCDERGSEEYNLALGERRANSTKQYLVDLGVSSSRLDTVRFGEAKPSVMGHDESAWRYNRRSEFTAQ